VKRLRRRLGLTLIEVVVSAAIGAVALGLGATLTSRAQQDSNSSYIRTRLKISSTESTDLLVRELQLATMVGEDANGNHVLDAGEDTNRNGRLDSDWSLADGGVANAITFNIPVNGWLWSTPITYYVSNGVLMRRQDGLDREICRVVTTFQLTRTGNIVDIDLTVTNKDRYGRTWTEASSRRAYVRN
jgi:type II secretory pathway component PulJ